MSDKREISPQKKREYFNEHLANLKKIHPQATKTELMKKVQMMWRMKTKQGGRQQKSWHLYQMDVVEWLEMQPDHSLPSLMVGIPDISEVRALVDKRYRLYEEVEYIAWFRRVAQLIFKKVSRQAYCCFYQTDRNFPTYRLSKSYLVLDSAAKSKIPLLWHKIITKGVDQIDSRPTFSHLICFSYDAKSFKDQPDVVEWGHKSWANATADNAVKLFLAQVKEGPADMPPGSVDLFAGYGTVMQHSLKVNIIPAIGVEIDNNNCNQIKKILGEV